MIDGDEDSAPSLTTVKHFDEHRDAVNRITASLHGLPPTFNSCLTIRAPGLIALLMTSERQLAVAIKEGPLLLALAALADLEGMRIPDPVVNGQHLGTSADVATHEIRQSQREPGRPSRRHSR